MQDQGKRLILAVVLMLGVLYAWQAVFGKKQEPAKKPAQGSAAAQKQAPQPTGPAPAPDIVATTPETQTHPRGPEQKIKLSFENVVVEFSNYGGVLSSWQLTDPRYQHDATKGQLIPTKFMTGEMGVGFSKDSQFKLPKQTEWTGKQTSPTQVVYTIKTEHLEVTKTFDVVPDTYVVRCTIVVKPADNAHEQVVVTTYGYQNPKTDETGTSRIQPRIWQSATDRHGSIVSTSVTSLLDRKDGGPRYEKDFQWTGFEHPFLLMGFAPKVGPGGSIEKHTFADGGDGLMRTDIVYPGQNGQASYELVGYLGPNSWSRLTGADTAAGFATGFRDVMDFGWFGFIGRPLLWLLLHFQMVVGNWGIAIILLTILVKLVTLPFVTKSMRSMKTMSLLAPQLKELNKKYEGDKQRIQVETMALYKNYGVNPLTGCLPMFLQMPIWVALYRMLSNAGELYHQPFIPGWIGDLTAADPYYVLPVVLCIAMFFQARLTPASPDPSQKTQQTLMRYGMPLGFGVFSFFFPSGLTLYIFTNTLLTAVQSIWLNKYDPKTKAIAEQFKAKQDELATKAAKGAKDANPKMPKAVVVADKKDGDEDAAVDEIVAAKPKPRQPGQQQKRKKKARR
jgi:YidC/Oxa1 family membrane protein insertase